MGVWLRHLVMAGLIAWVVHSLVVYIRARNHRKRLQRMMQQITRPFQVNFGLIAVAKDSNGVERVVHFTGFEKPPTDFDRRDMLRELAEDPEFGLVGVDVELVDAPLEQVELYAERGRKALGDETREETQEDE